MRVLFRGSFLIDHSLDVVIIAVLYEIAVEGAKSMQKVHQQD